MRNKISALLLGLMVPFTAFAQEGTPSYYQNGYASGYQQAPGQYGYQNNTYVGSQSQKQVIGQRSYSYQVPAQNNSSLLNGTMTPNGVSIPPENKQTDFTLTATYSREFADFQFETGVQSILEWDDMVINTIGAKLEKDFKLRDYDLYAYGEYSYGIMSHGGLSMDYDLKPYSNSDPKSGVFTISMGDQSGKMQDMKIGLGARNIWNVGGWNITPTIGYEMFKHDLKMSNHIYPNPAVYIPLMNQQGDYIYGDDTGKYYAVAPGTTVPDNYYQVCLTPEDLALAASAPDGSPILIDTNGDGILDSLQTTTYDPLYEYQPWGVGAGDCVVVGGDGTIKVSGVTHIYDTTWSGVFLGVEIEKQMTYSDKLRFYGEVSMPHYASEGTWPNRTDWQQNPSFIDEGDNGALHYQAEMEYLFQLSDRMQLSIKVDTTYFHIGQIGGKLYVAGYQYYATDSNGNLIYDDTNNNGIYGDAGDSPHLAKKDPYTENLSDSLKNATWQSFGLHLGVKYAF